MHSELLTVITVEVRRYGIAIPFLEDRTSNIRIYEQTRVLQLLIISSITPTTPDR